MLGEYVVVAVDGAWKKDRGERRNEQWVAIRRRYELLKAHLDERARRCWAGAEALAYGRGGITVVSEACGISAKMVKAGTRDLQQPETRRVRRVGGGRKRLKEKDPGLVAALQRLVDPATRGDPESPLRWTSKSLAKLAGELTAAGHPVSPGVVGDLLKEQGYSLQANRKTLEGKQHPDRDAQFQHIAEKSKQFMAAGDPVISVDTKKKEKLGNLKNAGQEYEPRGQPQRVDTHDFGQRDAAGQIVHGIPYGVYDPARNAGWVSVGVDHDTAEFAVTSIGQWWKNMGHAAYPDSRRVLITADCGGSNGSRVRAWKAGLQRLADQTGLEFHVTHFPPGTSKWNKIEHRMFSQITLNWRGRPLTSHEVIVNLIANTTTRTGLRIQAALDPGRYPTGVKIPQSEMDALRIEADPFHPEWNYTIFPRRGP